MNSRTVVIATVCGAAALSGCEPCSTTFSCEQAPRVAVVGQIRDNVTGAPVSDARIAMHRASGVAFLGDSAVTITGSDGSFQVAMPTQSLGNAVVTISVASPGRTPYQVLAVPARATITTGEATILRPWVAANPTLPYVVELYRNGTSDDRIANSSVTFRRTGGVRMFLNGVEVNQTSTTTNEIGWAFPFFDVTADAAGDVIGDLVVRLSAPLDSAIIPSLSFPALPVFGPPLGLVRLGVGPG